MTLRLAKLQNVALHRLLILLVFTSDTTHASMAWRTAYFNYGISGLCKDKELCKVLV